MNYVIEVEHLRKTYGRVIAVEDVSFEIAEGEIFGLLGPNGRQDYHRRNHPSIA